MRRRPRLVIEIPYGGRPRIRLHVDPGGQAAVDSIYDYVDADPELRALVHDAVQIAREDAGDDDGDDE